MIEQLLKSAEVGTFSKIPNCVNGTVLINQICSNQINHGAVGERSRRLSLVIDKDFGRFDKIISRKTSISDIHNIDVFIILYFISVK